MQARALTFAALASGVFLTGAVSGPVTTKYRIQQMTEQEIDLTAAGQGKQQRRNASSMFVAITLSDSAAGMSVIISALTPRVKVGTKVGEAWTDTTDVTNDIPSGSMTIRTVTNFKATGTETRGGVKALKVDATSSSALTGQQAGATIEGTGTSNATYYMGPDGRLVESNATSSSTLALTTPQLPDPIPLTIKGTFSVTMIK